MKKILLLIFIILAPIQAFGEEKQTIEQKMNNTYITVQGKKISGYKIAKYLEKYYLDKNNQDAREAYLDLWLLYDEIIYSTNPLKDKLRIIISYTQKQMEQKYNINTEGTLWDKQRKALIIELEKIKKYDKEKFKDLQKEYAHHLQKYKDRKIDPREGPAAVFATDEDYKKYYEWKDKKKHLSAFQRGFYGPTSYYQAFDKSSVLASGKFRKKEFEQLFLEGKHLRNFLKYEEKINNYKQWIKNYTSGGLLSDSDFKNKSSLEKSLIHTLKMYPARYKRKFMNECGYYLADGEEPYKGDKNKFRKLTQEEKENFYSKVKVVYKDELNTFKKEFMTVVGDYLKTHNTPKGIQWKENGHFITNENAFDTGVLYFEIEKEYVEKQRKKIRSKYKKALYEINNGKVKGYNDLIWDDLVKDRKEWVERYLNGGFIKNEYKGKDIKIILLNPNHYDYKLITECGYYLTDGKNTYDRDKYLKLDKEEKEKYNSKLKLAYNDKLNTFKKELEEIGTINF